MFHRIALLSLVAGFMMNGCASLSKQECASADWTAIGYRDGSYGKPASRFTKHQKACAKHGYKADFAIYKDGHIRGLEEVYCKPGKGYQLGLKGMGYNNVCPPSAEPAFLAAYHYGRDIHRMQRSYKALTQQAGTLRAEIARVEERMSTLERDTHGNDWDSRTHRVEKLRRERRKTEAEYDQIKLTRPLLLQSQTLLEHLQQESIAHNQRTERYITPFIEKLGSQDYHRRQFRRLVRLSIEKGYIKSKINWINRTPEVPRSRRQQTKTLRRQLRDLLPTINGLKYELLRNRKNKRGPFNQRSTSYYEAKLEQLMVQAAYEGALKHHNEVLEYMESHRRDQAALYLLIDAHFEAELVNVDQRMDNVRLHRPSEEEWKAQMQRKRELRESQRKLDEYLNQLKDLEQKISMTQKKIEKMKSASRY